MRLLIDFIAFFAINSQITLLLLLFSHHHQHVYGNTEVDINLKPSSAAAVQEHQNIAALTNENSNFFHSNGDMLEISDVESVPITIGGGNVSIGNGNHAGKLYNWDDSRDDYMGSIDMYSETGDYDYGKYINVKNKIYSKK